MICVKAGVPAELLEIDDELKMIYHSNDSFCVFLFKSRELRNRFMEETKGMLKDERMKVYDRYCK